MALDHVLDCMESLHINCPIWIFYSNVKCTSMEAHNFTTQLLKVCGLVHTSKSLSLREKTTTLNSSVKFHGHKFLVDLVTACIGRCILKLARCAANSAKFIIYLVYAPVVFPIEQDDIFLMVCI